MAHGLAGEKLNQPLGQPNSHLSCADSPRMMHSKGFSPPKQMFPSHRMLSIFILFMLDLCVADQLFSCCNQTCLVEGCQGKTDAPRPRLPLPSAVQAPLLLQATPAVWRPCAGGKPPRCAACGTVFPDRLCWKAYFPSGRNIFPDAGPHHWGGWDHTAASRWPGCSASQHRHRTSVHVLLSKHVLVYYSGSATSKLIMHKQSCILLSSAKKIQPFFPLFCWVLLSNLGSMT